MPPVLELLDKADAILKDVDALQAKADSAEDKEAKDKLAADIKGKQDEFDALEVKIEQAKAQAERQKRLATAREALKATPQGNVGEEPPKLDAQAKDGDADERLKVEAVYDYISASADGKAMSGEMREALRPQSEHFKAGQDGIALPKSVVRGIFGKAWYDLVFGKENPLLSTGTGQGEASLVPQEYIRQLLQLSAEPTHVFQLATVVPCATGTLTYPRLVQTDANEYAGVSFTWISEGAAKPETKPTFEPFEVSTHELAGHTEISLRMLARSAVNLEALLASLYRDAALSTLDGVMMTGSGVGQPLGIINDAGVRTVARQVVNQVEYTDLVNLKHLLLAHHRGGARFVLDDTVEAHLELIHELNYAAQPTRNARPLFAASIASGPYDRLVGYPYNVSYRAPNLGQAGDISFGNWAQYLVAMEQEVVIKRSDHYEFLNNVATFVMYLVVGGRAWQPRAFAYLEAGAS